MLHVLLPLDEGCSIAEIADAYGHSPRWARTLAEALLEELKAQTCFDRASTGGVPHESPPSR